MSHPDILSALTDCLRRDRQLMDIPDWQLAWVYADETDWMNFSAFTGPEQFIDMFSWAEFKPLADSLSGDPDHEALRERSMAFDRRVLEHYGLEIPKGIAPTATLNAQDYRYQTILPDCTTGRILDFGPGIGRQINLWSQHPGLELYEGMDAVPLMYCLQHLYYAASALPLCEYAFSEDLQNDSPCILHLPTWRHDLLPEKHFDMIICVQVLGELRPELLAFLIPWFKSRLRPDGALYLRDHGDARNRNGQPVEAMLSEAGFKLAMRPDLIDDEDIHGIPRIWRKA